jgi:hypothetical protein
MLHFTGLFRNYTESHSASSTQSAKNGREQEQQIPQSQLPESDPGIR